jgi:hypothetical protein
MRIHLIGLLSCMIIISGTISRLNILIKGLKTLISMCHSNDALIRESHQQMSHRLSTLEECQREVHASMGFETLEPVVYPPLPPPAIEDPWAWYRNTEEDDDDEIEEESK